MMDRKDCDKQRYKPPTKPHRRTAVMAGCVWLLCCAQPARAQSVRIHASALVDHDPIRLADVARLEGFPADQLAAIRELEIAASPDFGQNKLVTLDDIHRALIDAQVNMSMVYLKGSSRCVVRRPAELPIDKEFPLAGKRVAARNDQTLRSQIRRYIAKQLAEYGGQIELDFGRSPQSLLELAGPTYTFTIETRSRKKIGKIDLQVSIRRGLDEPQAHKISVAVSLSKEVVVAVNTIARGQIIARADVLIETRPFKKLEHIGMAELAGVVGQEAKRRFRVGDMIRGEDIKSKVLVKRNDLVRVLASSGGVSLEGVGTALQKGTLGDVIEVRNESSGESFWVRVTGLRQVMSSAGQPAGRASAAGNAGGVG